MPCMAAEAKLSHTAAMILQAISAGYVYGFSIMEVTGLPSGTVYPAMRRLERDDRGNPVGGVVVLPVCARGQNRQTAGDDHQAKPLPPLQAKAEEALCEQSQ